MWLGWRNLSRTFSPCQQIPKRNKRYGPTLQARNLPEPAGTCRNLLLSGQEPPRNGSLGQQVGVSRGSILESLGSSLCKFQIKEKLAPVCYRRVRVFSLIWSRRPRQVPPAEPHSFIILNGNLHQDMRVGDGRGQALGGDLRASRI